MEHEELKVLGDGDPIDAVEIGGAALGMGSVTAVRPLGVLAMIDEGELDWKCAAHPRFVPSLPKPSFKSLTGAACDPRVIALRRLLVINVDDPLAASLHNVADVEEHCPGVVSGVREWFRWYKTPDDKPINAFGASLPPFRTG